MPLSFMNDTVTVIRAAERESRGSTVKDWEHATEHEVARCQVTNRTTAQERDGRVANVADGMTLRAPYGSDIRAGDRVRWDGDVYEVDGDVFNTKSPTGAVSNLKCALRLWRG